ncbi:MAG: hypothetical protein AB7E23_02350 [Bacilli bacterium]
MKKPRLTKFFGLIPAIALLVSCQVGTSDTTVLEDENLAYATLSINPSVALMLNEQKQVATATALNADGEMIMLNLQLEGKTLDEAVEDIIDETVELDFINEETPDPVVETDVLSSMLQLQTQTRDQIQTRVNNVFDGHNISVQTRTRTYTQQEIDDAEAKGVTPLKLELMHKAMIGNNELLEEEALELTTKELLTKVRNGAQNMNKIAASLGQAFLEERQLIQDTYRADILSLKEEIALALENGEPTDQLEIDLATLREEMVQALQNLIGDYRQQTMTARQNWQQEADSRRQDGSGPNTSNATNA